VVVSYDLGATFEPHRDRVADGRTVRARREPHVDAIDLLALPEQSLRGRKVHQRDAAVEQRGGSDGIDEATHH
jgi:hypothetical protein